MRLAAALRRDRGSWEKSIRLRESLPGYWFLPADFMSWNWNRRVLPLG